ncbi:MAG: GNAT family N-acetyltransferase [Trebonia sp.]
MAPVYALLADGTTVEIRPAGPGDFDAVKAMHEAMSRDNIYMRFFNVSRLAAETEARRICQDPAPDQVALLALASDEMVGVASYVALGKGNAEVAFAVADHMHHKGIATLLLEHLVSYARSHQITTFTAETLTENQAMLNVFADAGLPVDRHYADGVFELTFPLPSEDAGPTLDSYLNAVAERESRAEAASLQHVLAPKSVAVIGASRRRGTVGRAIVDNIRAGGYAGRLYTVNPRARQIGGERCLASVLDLPEAVDLAVIAVPAATVLDVAERCGQRGVRSLVVISSGLDTGAHADLLAVSRRHGMRLVGPDCFGVAVPGIGLDATFAARPAKPGVTGLVMQSGGLGFALVDHLSRLGIVISSFASVGDKLDVSGNDMLMWWEHDGLTKLAVLYIESFGNPRKFARTARRVSGTMPVLTVLADRSALGQAALFEQAGVIATHGFGDLIEAAALLAAQPVPAGRTVAIVSNVGGAGVLAADACTDLGLAVHHPRGQLKHQLHALVPGGGAVTGPVDTTATVSRDDFRQVLELITADEDVDAMIALVLPTGATGDLVAAITDADVRVPLVAVVLDQAEAVRLLDARNGKIPAYGYPEAAAGALARAARYGEWRAAPHTLIPGFSDVHAAEARAMIRGFLAQAPDGGWLPPADVTELLRLYGIPLVAATEVRTVDDAAAAATAVGYPVVVKADVPGLVHKTDAGAVLLDLRTEDDVRAGYRQLAGQFGGRLTGVLVEPMITGGTEVIIGVRDDQMFGPLVVFGLGGVATEVLADHAARLAPLTETDANTLINSIRSAPLLHGHRGAPAADIPALCEVLMRVSRLADDLPEVTELDLNPVIARQLGAVAVDARIRVTPQVPQDPFLRRLGLTCRPRGRPD